MKIRLFVLLACLCFGLGSKAWTPDSGINIGGLYYDLYKASRKAVVANNVGGRVCYSGDVVIPDSVTYRGVTYVVAAVGRDAFYGSDSLMSIQMPETITSIENYAFSGCRRLTCIRLPQNVDSMGICIFSGCDNLLSIRVDEANSSYASVDGVLYNKSLTELICCPEGKEKVTIPPTVKTVGYRAFEHCRLLSAIHIPSSVKTIDFLAFFKCERLKRVVIPKGVESIGDYAFSDCINVTGVNIPASVKHIGEGVFRGCFKLSAINVAPANSAYSSVGGVVYNKRQTTLLCCPEGRVNVAIPRTVKEIGQDAFYWCDTLADVQLPDGVKTIGDDAFWGCKRLTRIRLPRSVTAIGEGAFSGCEGLESIEIPQGVTSLEYSTFEGCTNLRQVSVPASVKYIGGGVFKNCRNLRSIYMKTSVPPFCDGWSFEITMPEEGESGFGSIEDFYSTAVLYVPKGSRARYRSDGDWGEFKNIREWVSRKGSRPASGQKTVRPGTAKSKKK